MNADGQHTDLEFPLRIEAVGNKREKVGVNFARDPVRI
jgi:hypothetical protein